MNQQGNTVNYRPFNLTCAFSGDTYTVSCGNYRTYSSSCMLRFLIYILSSIFNIADLNIVLLTHFSRCFFGFFEFLILNYIYIKTQNSTHSFYCMITSQIMFTLHVISSSRLLMIRCLHSSIYNYRNNT
jgi:hypothetical protein